MAEVIWAIPALNDLEGILEYIALENLEASRRLARKTFETTDRLASFPKSGSKPKELKVTPCRKLIVGPVIIYHRQEGDRVYIVHVTRAEREFDLARIVRNDPWK